MKTKTKKTIISRFSITKIDKYGNEHFVNAQTNLNAKNVKTTEDMYDDVRNWWDKTVDRYKEKFGEELGRKTEFCRL